MRSLSLYFALILLTGFGASSAEKEHVREKRQSNFDDCDPQWMYRDTFSFCNNLDIPGWGSAYDVLSRYLPAEYDDKKGTPRQKASDGSPLPNARVVSTTVHFEKQLKDCKHSVMLMQWGQFINHDMIATPNTTDAEGNILDCCEEEDDVTKNPASPCFPIYVGGRDPFFENGRCFSLVRNEAEIGTGTVANPRNTFNGASAFIDGSHIYGPYPELESQLREKKGGRLKTHVHNGKSFPPKNEPEFCFNGDKEESYCFLTGDLRANVFVGLGAMHTIFLREHNRLVAFLALRHPDWDDCYNR